MRSNADYAEFALNNVNIGGNSVTVTKCFPASDPQLSTNPACQGLGQYIGQDNHVMDPRTFIPWGGPGGSRHKSNIGSVISQPVGANQVNNGHPGAAGGGVPGGSG